MRYITEMESTKNIFSIRNFLKQAGKMITNFCKTEDTDNLLKTY